MTDIKSALVIIACTLIAGMMVFVFYKLWQYIATQPKRENYENVPSSATTLMLTNEDERAILDGKWSEKVDSIPPSAKNKDMTFYCSCFSQLSTADLKSTPYTWKSMVKAVPDDDKIIFRNPIQIRNTSDLYSAGILLNLNQGNGPKAMNLGINTVNPTDSQQWTVFTLVSFGALKDVGSSDVINLSANTPNNVGVVLTATNKLTDVDGANKVSFKLSVATSIKETQTEINLIQTAFTQKYGLLVLRKSPNDISFRMYTIDINEEELTSTHQQSMDLSIEYTGNIEFSNKRSSFGNYTNPSVISLMTLGIYKQMLGDAELISLTNYYNKILRLVSQKSLNRYQVQREFVKSPYADKVVQEACASVTDWRSPNQIMSAPKECRTSIHDFCKANPTALGCECYSETSKDNPACTIFKNILNNTSACTQGDFEKYKQQNDLCPCVDSKKKMNDYDHLQKVIAMLRSKGVEEPPIVRQEEDGLHLQKLVNTSSQKQEEMKQPEKNQQGFFKWLVGSQ